MDSYELHNALSNVPLWEYVCAMIVSLCRAIEGPNADLGAVHRLIRPMADSLQLDLLTTQVFLTCLRKTLVERFLPLCPLLKDAFLEEVQVLQEAFNPISQDIVLSGFQLNDSHAAVSLSELLQWVITQGMRSPFDNSPLVRIRRIVKGAEAFPPINASFVEHVNHHSEGSLVLQSVANIDTVEAAHASVNSLISEFDAACHSNNVAGIYSLCDRLMDFMYLWDISPYPTFFYEVLAAATEQDEVFEISVQVIQLQHIDIAGGILPVGGWLEAAPAAQAPAPAAEAPVAT